MKNYLRKIEIENQNLTSKTALTYRTYCLYKFFPTRSYDHQAGRTSLLGRRTVQLVCVVCQCHTMYI